jgi:hypothetical protein
MRQPKPWCRSSKNAWYVEHRGKQCRLGEHPDGAPPPKKAKAGWNDPQLILDVFYKLMAADPSALPRPADVLAAQVCDLFLSHAERHNEPATYRSYQYFFQTFCDVHGRVLARDLKPIHVTVGWTPTRTGTAAAGMR